MISEGRQLIYFFIGISNNVNGWITKQPPCETCDEGREDLPGASHEVNDRTTTSRQQLRVYVVKEKAWHETNLGPRFGGRWLEGVGVGEDATIWWLQPISKKKRDHSKDEHIFENTS